MESTGVDVSVLETSVRNDMCSKEQSGSGGLQAVVGAGYGGGLVEAGGPLEQYRLQLYQYALAAQRLSAAHYPICTTQTPYGPGYPPRLAALSLLPRGLQPEEPKPQHSYIGLIAMAILSSPEYKLVLSDIYQYILDHYPYFRTRGPGWRNSIRHNLSLNDCFVKAGRSANGKGHYWAIHPANVEDFKKGDFRRRKAQRKVRKHMGLAVEDDGTDSPSPPPVSTPPRPPSPPPPPPPTLWSPAHIAFPRLAPPRPRKRRQFDVDSLLAPDEELAVKKAPFSSSDDDEDIDVVSSGGGGGGGGGLLVQGAAHCWPPMPPPEHARLVVTRYYGHLAATAPASSASLPVSLPAPAPHHHSPIPPSTSPLHNIKPEPC